MLANNLIALIITFGLALLWLRINDFAAHRGWVSGSLSRKIIHTGTGPVFVLCWLLFNTSPYARFLAALVPLAITVQFALVGLGIIDDPSAVEAMSRTGNRKDILRGPLYYGIVFVVLTILFWKDNPAGLVGLMLLCGGDGMAEIVGKRVMGPRLPWSARKSWIGSLAMFLGGLLFSTIVLDVFLNSHVFPGTIGHYLIPLILISLAGTVVESLPFTDIDNLTVPATAVVLGRLFF